LRARKLALKVWFSFVAACEDDLMGKGTLSTQIPQHATFELIDNSHIAIRVLTCGLAQSKLHVELLTIGFVIPVRIEMENKGCTADRP
jgi:hypothetical protein